MTKTAGGVHLPAGCMEGYVPAATTYRFPTCLVKGVNVVLTSRLILCNIDEHDLFQCIRYIHFIPQCQIILLF